MDVICKLIKYSERISMAEKIHRNQERFSELPFQNFRAYLILFYIVQKETAAKTKLRIHTKQEQISKAL